MILSSLLFWIVLPLAFQFYKQLYADDEISRLIVVLHVCRAVYCPVTGHKPSGEAGIITEARPSQRHVTSDFSTAVANKGPSRLPVDRDDWEQRKVARFYLQRPSLLRRWHPITVLGDLQHDFLDDAMDKNLMAHSIHAGHSELIYSSSNDSAAGPTGTLPAHLLGLRAGRAQVTTTRGRAQYTQEKQG